MCPERGVNRVDNGKKKHKQDSRALYLVTREHFNLLPVSGQQQWRHVLSKAVNVAGGQVAGELDKLIGKGEAWQGRVPHRLCRMHWGRVVGVNNWFCSFIRAYVCVSLTFSVDLRIMTMAKGLVVYLTSYWLLVLLLGLAVSCTGMLMGT